MHVPYGVNAPETVRHLLPVVLPLGTSPDTSPKVGVSRLVKALSFMYANRVEVKVVYLMLQTTGTIYNKF